MCIIISKDKKCDRLPTIGELTNCFEYNRDGAGFMYVNHGRVIIEKGFMRLDDFLTRFKMLCKQFDDFKQKALVIHCRIGTSSGNTPENTHPYAITTKEKNLHKLYFETDLAIVHNGIISAYTPANRQSKTNDTQNFILQYLAPIHKHYKTAYKMQKFREGIKNITNSKFVFLDKNERTYYVGDFINENGLKFSNSTYKTFTRYYNNFDYFIEKGYAAKTEKDVKNDFDDEYFDDYIYYDAKKSLIYLEHNWTFYADGSHVYEYVKNYENDLIFDLNTGELFELNDLGNLSKLYDYVTVYDEKYNEIY